MKFLIGGSLILLAILNFDLANVVMGIEAIIILLGTYLIVKELKNRNNH